MILAIDTSTRNTSLALGDGDSLWEINYTGNGTVSATILEQIDFLLSMNGIARGDIRCLAVGAGPGSFTGLRVSFSLVRSLSMALSIPVITVNSLDAIAFRYSAIGTLSVLRHARKGFAYLSRYNNGRRCAPVAYVSPEEAAAILSSMDAPPHLAGDAASGFCDIPAGSVLVDVSGITPASAVLRMALPLHLGNEYVPFEEILPDYMRQSDAEEKAGLTDG